MNRKRTKVIRIILGALIPMVYIVIHIPPNVTMNQIISAIIIFFVIIYIAIKALKYFKTI